MQPRLAGECRVDTGGLGWGPMAGSCEYSDEPSGSGTTNLVVVLLRTRGSLFTMELYCTPKVNTLQLNTVGNSSNTRTRPTRTISELSLL
jgi:hypothetical protein